jgi:phage terminase small subunit
MMESTIKSVKEPDTENNSANETTAPTAKPKRSGGKQPLRHQCKNKVALRKRAKQAIELLVQGETAHNAGIKVGYSPAYASNGVKALLQNPLIQNDIAAILDRAGVTDSAIADKIHGLMQAKTLKKVGKYDVREVNDNQAQLGATQLAAKLRGHMIDRSVNLNVNLDVAPVDLSKYRSQTVNIDSTT